MPFSNSIGFAPASIGFIFSHSNRASPLYIWSFVSIISRNKKNIILLPYIELIRTCPPNFSKSNHDILKIKDLIILEVFSYTPSAHHWFLCNWQELLKVTSPIRITLLPYSIHALNFFVIQFAKLNCLHSNFTLYYFAFD